MSQQMYDYSGDEYDGTKCLLLLEGYAYFGNVSLVNEYKAALDKPWKFRFELWVDRDGKPRVFEGEGEYAWCAIAEGTTKHKNYLDGAE